MATPTGTFRPGQNPFDTDSVTNATAMQLRMWNGELIGIFERGLEVAKHVKKQTIEAGLSWQCPAYGLIEAPTYHTEGEDILIEASTYLKRIPVADKTFYIDKPLVLPAMIPDFDEFQLHYSMREPLYRQMVERLARRTDMKACRMLANAAGTGGNVTGGEVPSGSETPGGYEITDAGMLTSATVLISALKSAAQRLDENDVPATGRKCILHPQQYYNLVNDRQLLDRDVIAVPGGNGGIDRGTVYMAFGIELMKSNALKAMRTAGDYTNDADPGAGDNAPYTAINANAHAGNAGIVFTEQSVTRLVRKEVEMKTWYQDSRYAHVAASRLIDGYGVYRSECTVAFRTV